MPFANTWTEELVAEWLQIENYLVVTRLPGLSTLAGGRYEPDIVGARVDNGRLKIRHCEVTAGFTGSPTATSNRYANKFSPNLCEKVTEYFRESFGIKKEPACEYEKWVIVGDFSPKTEDVLKQKLPDVCLYRMHDFIPSIVLPSIRKWQIDNKYPTGSRPMLSQGLWLLQLLEYMNPDEKTLARRQARQPLR